MMGFLKYRFSEFFYLILFIYFNGLPFFLLEWPGFQGFFEPVLELVPTSLPQLLNTGIIGMQHQA